MITDTIWRHGNCSGLDAVFVHPVRARASHGTKRSPMQHHEKQLHHSPKELLAALATTQGNAMLQIGLLSMEARDRWRALEIRVEHLQARLEREGDKLSETVGRNALELTEAVHSFLHEQAHVVALSTPAKSLMQKPVSCLPSDRLGRVAQIMWELDCGAVPVVAEDGALIGILTDRDVCMAAYTSGRPLADIPVTVAMTHEVATVGEDAPLQVIFELMRERRVRRIPVVHGGALVGIVSLCDIARWNARHGETEQPAGAELAHTISVVCERRGSNRHTATSPSGRF